MRIQAQAHFSIVPLNISFLCSGIYYCYFFRDSYSFVVVVFFFSLVISSYLCRRFRWSCFRIVIICVAQFVASLLYVYISDVYLDICILAFTVSDARYSFTLLFVYICVKSCFNSNSGTNIHRHFDKQKNNSESH